MASILWPDQYLSRLKLLGDHGILHNPIIRHNVTQIPEAYKNKRAVSGRLY